MKSGRRNLVWWKLGAVGSGCSPQSEDGAGVETRTGYVEN